MKKHVMKVKLTLTETILGMASANPDIHSEFIASKAPTPEKAAEEVKSIVAEEENSEEKFEKAMTVFPKDENGMFLWDYHIKGFMKSGLLWLIELGECKISKWSYKKAVDMFITIEPRRIYLCGPDGKPIKKAEGILQRPLRAETMRGDRICLASSEMLPPGTTLTCEITSFVGEGKTKLAAMDADTIKDVLSYGQHSGLGQWRGGGYGRFTWEEVKS